MIKIGKRILVANFSQLQIPSGEAAEIDFEIAGWKIKVVVDFVNDGAEQGVQVQSTSSDRVHLIFRNWTNSLGSSLRSPARLAVLQQGGALEFLATNYRIGDMNVFSLQFLHDLEAK